MTAACGLLSLWVTGSFGAIGAAIFVGMFALAWLLEGTRYQVPERLGTVLVVLTIPAFYAAWWLLEPASGGSGSEVAATLGRLILTISALKLLQKKNDRDWVFVYLLAFFEVLLGAGLSMGAPYVLSFGLFVFFIVCTTIVLEAQRARRIVGKAAPPARESGGVVTERPRRMFRLSVTATSLILLTVLFAIPIFFLLPRFTGASAAGHQRVSTSSGFSDSVRLGGIGSIQENDAIVMHVKTDDNTESTRVGLHWRGIALDRFDNQSWSRSESIAKEPRMRNERDLIQLDYPSGRGALSVQTVYLEPLDAPILFGLPRIVAVQGNFPVLFRDPYGSVSFSRTPDRISYKVLSDQTTPPVAELRSDRAKYTSADRPYLQLPADLDPRIAELAGQVTRGTYDRYEAARAVESHLRDNYGYTLVQKSGGEQPLADFLFNVREGHCEYFATAMAIMLRTRGIATRVVNGFSQGEYNSIADVWTVRQKNAHSWVEVYFPGEGAWITFDPTPPAGRLSSDAAGGFTDRFRHYMDALESIWVQYFVAFDNNGQRSLFSRLRRGLMDYQEQASEGLSGVGTAASQWWKEVGGGAGAEQRSIAIRRGLSYLIPLVIASIVLVLLVRYLWRSKFWRRWQRSGTAADHRAATVAFYERMIATLAAHGITRKASQTPLEFAAALDDLSVTRITEEYNRVRFGEHEVGPDESLAIERMLGDLERDLAARSHLRVVSSISG